MIYSDSEQQIRTTSVDENIDPSFDQSSLTAQALQHNMSAPTVMNQEKKIVADDFVRLLSPDTALPVAAIKTLIGVIRRSSNTTIRGMEAELKEAIQLMEDTLEKENPDNRCETSVQ